MRDIALSLILIGFMPVSIVRPFIGALVFAVISLANPHRLTWGFAFSLPWAMAFAVLTVLGLLFNRERMIGDSIRRYLPMLIYLAWMGITTVFALERDSAIPSLETVAKIHLMCLVTLCLVTDWRKCKQLVWVSVCSIAFYGLKGGIFTITGGGQYIVWGPIDSAIRDNNHLAVGLVMMLPMMYWLYMQAKARWLKLFIAFSAFMCMASIFGSHSRSAFLGIAAISIFLLLKSRHKVVVGIVITISFGVLASVMPGSYWDRMETIETYQEDASAMGRINTWKTAINIASQRITGGGFDFYSPDVFARYAPEPNNVHSSHSIYFQALGEHGWIGFALFVFILVYTWFQCRHAIKYSQDSEDGHAQALLARMIQVSIIGLCVGGAFVNIGNWDMVYYLAITALALARIVDQAPRRDHSHSDAVAGLRTAELALPTATAGSAARTFPSVDR